MKDRPKPKPTGRRQGERPVTGWGSPLAQLAAASRRGKARVSLPSLKFLATDDEAPV
jgi:hypothetical protein